MCVCAVTCLDVSWWVLCIQIQPMSRWTAVPSAALIEDEWTFSHPYPAKKKKEEEENKICVFSFIWAFFPVLLSFSPVLSRRTPSPPFSSAAWSIPPYARGKVEGHLPLFYHVDRFLCPTMGSAGQGETLSTRQLRNVGTETKSVFVRFATCHAIRSLSLISFSLSSWCSCSYSSVKKAWREREREVGDRITIYSQFFLSFSDLTRSDFLTVSYLAKPPMTAGSTMPLSSMERGFMANVSSHWYWLIKVRIFSFVFPIVSMAFSRGLTVVWDGTKLANHLCILFTVSHNAFDLMRK